jgi:predicted SprT family Zn-dependent metalloprotease
MNLDSARRLARTLMTQHGLNHWRFEWDNAKGRFGACHFGDEKITLSKHLVLLNSEDEVRQVMLHEIAHALVGRGHHHDAVWARKARSIGYLGKRTHSAATPAKKWLGVCEKCGEQFPRNRRTAEAYHPRCGKDAKINWVPNPKALQAA